MKAFSDFKEIDSKETIQAKHKAWLERYKGEGLIYSIAENGKHSIKWQTEKRRYKEFLTTINCIARLPNRTIIEFDDEDIEKARENLEKIQAILKEKGWGFIRSTHKGKTDYLWIEFNKEMKDKDVKSFLEWICPEGAIIDLNFASSRKVFPVMYAVHWKHSENRELPVEYFEGEQIDYNSLNINSTEGKTNFLKKEGFIYHTFKKAANIFNKDSQAEQFNKLQPLFYDRAGLWWLWNDSDKKWEIVDEIDILNMIKGATGMDTVNSKERNEILNALKQEGRKNIPQPMKKTWVQFKDTIVDVLTGEEIKASPKYLVTNPIPWNLHKERFVLTPTMDKIFEEWVGPEYTKLLYEIIAYSILPDYPIHRLFCLIGEGMNGKSKFLGLIKRFVGEENITSTELDTLLNSRFEVTRLYKKLVCIMGETNFSELSKTSIIKKLTGQDTIGFEYKNKNPFEGENYAKILIATNNLPATTDKTLGFYRRWAIIDFPNQFSEQKDILQDIPEEEYEMLAVKVLGILKDLLDKKRFTNEGSVEERTKKYEDKSNPFEKFMKEYVEEDLNAHIWKFEFERRFNAWCSENRFRQFPEETIGRKMKEKGIEQNQFMSDWLIDGSFKKLRAWTGIKWREKSQV